MSIADQIAAAVNQIITDGSWTFTEEVQYQPVNQDPDPIRVQFNRGQSEAVQLFGADAEQMTGTIVVKTSDVPNPQVGDRVFASDGTWRVTAVRHKIADAAWILEVVRTAPAPAVTL